MTDKEAFALIGERAGELAKRSEVRKKMLEICKKEGKEAAEQYVYTLAVATLCKGGN